MQTFLGSVHPDKRAQARRHPHHLILAQHFRAIHLGCSCTSGNESWLMNLRNGATQRRCRASRGGMRVIDACHQRLRQEHRVDDVDDRGGVAVVAEGDVCLDDGGDDAAGGREGDAAVRHAHGELFASGGGDDHAVGEVRREGRARDDMQQQNLHNHRACACSQPVRA